jgi:hypothetical protein
MLHRLGCPIIIVDFDLHPHEIQRRLRLIAEVCIDGMVHRCLDELEEPGATV